MQSIHRFPQNPLWPRLAVEARVENVRATSGLPVATPARMGNHERNGNAAEPHTLKVDERLRLARKRREEHLKQLASRERGWLAREERARRCYEQHLEDRRRKLEEQRQREERRRAAVEDKRRRRLVEDRERYESVVRRTMEKSQKPKARAASCSQRRGGGARSSTNAKRRSLSQWEMDLVSRLQTPTISYLARSRSAICLSKREGNTLTLQESELVRENTICPEVRCSEVTVLMAVCLLFSLPVFTHDFSCFRPNSLTPAMFHIYFKPQFHWPLGSAVHVCRRSASCHSVSSRPPQKLQQRCGAPPFRGVARPGANNPSIASPRVTKPSIMSPGLNSPSVTRPEVNNSCVSGPRVTNPSIATNPNIASSGVNSPSIVSPRVTKPSIVNPKVNNSRIRGLRVTDPSFESHEANSPVITGPMVNNLSNATPGVDSTCNVGPEVIEPNMASPGLNSPSITGAVVNHPNMASPGVNSTIQIASSMDQFPGSNPKEVGRTKPQSHTATAGVICPSGTIMQDRTIPSSTGYIIEKSLIRAPLRQAPPRPEGLPPLLEEEDPEPECSPNSSQLQPDQTAAPRLHEDSGQKGPVQSEPGSTEPPLLPARPQTTSEMTGARTQVRPMAGTTDPEQASRLLAERRRQARQQREREEEERRQKEESERQRREELAPQIAVDRVKMEGGAYCLQDERKRKEEDHQKTAEEEEDARRRSTQERTLQLQKEEEEAHGKTVADQQRLERESRFQREETERQERKKRLEEIMKRTRKTDPAEKQPASTSATKDILPNENVKLVPSLHLEDVIRLPGPPKVSKMGLGSGEDLLPAGEDLLPAVAFKERRSLRSLTGLEEIQAHQRAEVI
ncbi:uncharacterized protein map7a isoform X2 [Brachyhypopomus gauderio]|uniref:uncharacterized protein map7a isoform X2 n=1 Tax=Brachyhypopomus gauderio TaxID=698409 RepID=UPI0040419B1B